MLQSGSSDAVRLLENVKHVSKWLLSIALAILHTALLEIVHWSKFNTVPGSQ